MKNFRNKKTIAVCGLGDHAIKNILPSINQCDALSLYAVNSRSREVLNRVANEYNCLGFSDYDEILQNDEIDIIYLSTPPGVHYEQAKKSLLSGKHTWVEKPLTTDLEKTRKLIDISTSNNLSLFESLMYTYHPQFEFLMDYIRSNKLGDLIHISSKFGLPHMPNSGFRFHKKQGGSCLYDVGIYPISIILFLFKEQNIEIKDSDQIFLKEGIDVSGNCRLLINKKINCDLFWNYDASYKNEIDVWGSSSSLHSKKVFSKDSEYEPIFHLSDMNGNTTEVKISSSDHFIDMFEKFCSKMESIDFLNHHRQQILSLAQLMNKINNRNKR